MNICRSDGVNNSNGVNWSSGVHKSDGVNWSNGVNWSDGVNMSDGVNRSYGVNNSNGVNWSSGVDGSYGVNGSYGVFNSFGVDREFFVANKKRAFHIFGKEVTESRFYQVWEEWFDKLKRWYPKFNNAFQLYIQNGSDWTKVDASEITGILACNSSPYEVWKDMPKEALEWIQTLPEFDADIFKAVTGIDVTKKNTKKEELLKKAQELIDKANELKQQAEEI